jgi:hypothetical protein
VGVGPVRTRRKPVHGPRAEGKGLAARHPWRSTVLTGPTPTPDLAATPLSSYLWTEHSRSGTGVRPEAGAEAELHGNSREVSSPLTFHFVGALQRIFFHVGNNGPGNVLASGALNAFQSR